MKFDLIKFQLTGIYFISILANHTNFERRVQDYLQVVNNINLPKVGFNKGYKYEGVLQFVENNS